MEPRRECDLESRGTSRAAACSLQPSSWVEKYGDFLYRYAQQHVRASQVAEDLVQDTFVGALSAVDRYTGGASERTWLVGILRHKIMDHYRSLARRPQAISSDNPIDLGEAFFDRRGHWKQLPARWACDPKSLFEQGEFWTAFHECVSKLPDRLADAYCLRELSRLESKEVCEVLGIAPTNLWTQLHRARLMLRQCLEENWFRQPGKRKRT